jgi:hypothetical protein
MSTRNGLTITSANSTFLLGIVGLYSTAQQIQGFSSDAAFAIADADTAETQMGVDAAMSYGWVPRIYEQTVTLQADSSSGFLFETWVQTQDAAKEVYEAFGTITIPGIKRTYTLTNGVLRRVVIHPDAAKVMMPRRFTIHWGKVLPVPLG